MGVRFDPRDEAMEGFLCWHSRSPVSLHLTVQARRIDTRHPGHGANAASLMGATFELPNATAPTMRRKRGTCLPREGGSLHGDGAS